MAMSASGAGAGKSGSRGRGGNKPRRAAAAASRPAAARRPAARRAAGTNGRNDTSAAAHSPGLVKATIPSDYTAGRSLQEQILRDVERHGFSNDSAFAIRIALEEALVNAIKHGNRADPGKKIRVEARVNSRRAEITIEDEGGGFNRAGIPDPTLDENLHKCSGRGIHLIEAYMDDVQWSRGGRRLKMVKENHG